MNIVPFETKTAGRIRNMQYGGDNMEPTIGRRDFVTIETLEAYQGEGIYVFEIGGGIQIKRVQSPARSSCSRATIGCTAPTMCR